MLHSLKLHPDSFCLAATSIDVEVAVGHPGSVELAYIVTGAIDQIRWPPVTAARRGHELWRQTCFELFVRAAPDGAYYEFNFSPSRQWAVYRFAHYRTGMIEAAVKRAPSIRIQAESGRCILRTSLESDCVPDLPREAAWHLGLSAVIEDVSGRISYWALAHPPGKPDFHHSDCFAHELAPVVQP